jgi:hypothetical protein
VKGATAREISRALEAASDEQTARAQRRQIACLRGIRGASMRAVAEAADRAWRQDRPVLPDDEAVLDGLFATAWEDGLAAIALLAATIPDSADVAAEIARGWLDRTDDVLTADAIGWMILGPAAIASGGGAKAVLAGLADRPIAHRAAVSAGLAFTPTPLQGPCAAAVRARLDQTSVQWVGALDTTAVEAILTAFARDPDPGVLKGVRRLLRRWGEEDPSAALAWAESFRGGLPKVLREEVADLRRAVTRRTRA